MSTPRNPWRDRLVAALVVLVSLGVLLSTLGVWVHRQVYNTDAWISTVGELPSEPAVSEFIASELSTQIIEVSDAEQRIGALLPERAQVLAAPVTTALDELLERGITAVVESEQFHSVWLAANRFAHETIVRLLDDDLAPAEVHDGEIRLDLLAMVSTVLSELAEEAHGLLGDGEVPQIHPDTSRQTALGALSDYFGVEVPANFGQITLLQSSELATFQDAAWTAARVLWILLVATTAAMVLALLLSQHRRTTVVWIGLGVTVATVAGWTALRLALDAGVSSVDDSLAEAAARQSLAQILSGLRSTSQFVASTAAAVAAAAFLTGEGTVPRWVRAQFASMVKGLTVASPAVLWVARHGTGLRAAGLLTAVGIAALVDLSPTQAVALLVVLSAYLVASVAITKTVQPAET